MALPSCPQGVARNASVEESVVLFTQRNTEKGEGAILVSKNKKYLIVR